MAGSAVPRRMLGRELKKLRERSGVSAQNAARAIEVSPQTLWRMESGQDGPKLKELYIKILCGMYGASEELTDELIALVGEIKKPGWWHSFADALPADSELLIGLEEAAHQLTTFQTTVIPGLLQTEDYRRAILRIELPDRSVGERERLVELHTRRAARLRDAARPVGFRVLISESALYHEVGGPTVMAEQLEHLVSAGFASNISIRIVSQRLGNHLGLITGSFVLMDFPVRPASRLTEPPVVYVQGFTGALYLDRETEIEEYRRAVSQIQKIALDEGESRGLLRRAARECGA